MSDERWRDSYDHWKTTNPMDEFLGPEPDADPPASFDFSCKVCGVECDSAPPLPARAVCPAHCEDHDYIYDRGARSHYCNHCGQEPPLDWYEVD